MFSAEMGGVGEAALSGSGASMPRLFLFSVKTAEYAELPRKPVLFSKNDMPSIAWWPRREDVRVIDGRECLGEFEDIVAAIGRVKC